MTEMTLTRAERLKDRTLGALVVNDVYGFATLELPWKNNARNISCIPEGYYFCRIRTSKKYGKHIEILNVPNRTNILMHVGNFPKDTHGCILVGERFTELDDDGVKEVASSNKAMRDLVKICENSNDDVIRLVIKNGNV